MVFILDIMDALGLPDPQDRAIARFELDVLRYEVTGVCATDANNAYCMPKLQATTIAQPASVCNSISAFVTNAGCCARSWIDFNQGVCNIDQVIHPQTSTCQTQINQLETAIASCTNVKLGPSCAATKFLMMHEATLSGVDPNWLQNAQNMAALQNQLRTVIAYALGVDTTYIVALVIQAAATQNGRRLLQGPPDQTVYTNFTVPNNGVVIGATTGMIGSMETLGLNDLVTSPGTTTPATMTGVSVTNVAVVPTSGASMLCPVLSMALVVASLFM